MECPEIKRILFATDNSTNAQCAFNYATCCAKKFDAKVTLLHVVQEFKDMVAFDFGIERSVAAKKWFSVSNEYFQELKEKFADIAKEKYSDNLVDDVVIEKGNPVKMILTVAKDRMCDLIVMGSRGWGSLEDAMIGNTVTGVLRRSEIPVLVVREPKNDKGGLNNGR